jgi:formamidopyrimidine-DNA glycosylase
MPELPEVDALVTFLRPRIVGEFVTRTDIGELSILKTADPPLEALNGLEITGVSRVGQVPHRRLRRARAGVPLRPRRVAGLA